MTPTVSIITPTFNHTPYISACLESVFNQTSGDWEQIVIDDASSDKTFSIVSAFAIKDARIKVIRHQHRWGIRRLVDTYNQALELAKGDYIAILEGDDFWPPDKLEKQIAGLKNENVALAYGDWIMTNEYSKPIKIFTYREKSGLLNNSPIGSILMLFFNLRFFIMPSTVIINRKMLINSGGFKYDSNYPFTDFPTFLNLALIGKFLYQRQVLGYYRKQKHSSWFNFAVSTSAMGRVEMQNCLDNFWLRNKLKINKLKLNLLSQQNIRPNQNIFIKSKRDTKKLSLVLNYYAMGEKVKAVNVMKDVLADQSQSILNKVIIFVLLFFTRINIDIFQIVFKMQQLFYKVWIFLFFCLKHPNNETV